MIPKNHMKVARDGTGALVMQFNPIYTHFTLYHQPGSLSGAGYLKSPNYGDASEAEQHFDKWAATLGLKTAIRACEGAIDDLEIREPVASTRTKAIRNPHAD